MSDREHYTQQMAEIGARFIRRTLREIPNLREALQRARQGDALGLRDIERACHKIYGSGGMFGFAAVSQRAGEIERFAELRSQEAADLDRLDQLITSLQSEIEASIRTGGRFG